MRSSAHRLKRSAEKLKHSNSRTSRPLHLTVHPGKFFTSSPFSSPTSRATVPVPLLLGSTRLLISVCGGASPRFKLGGLELCDEQVSSNGRMDGLMSFPLYSISLVPVTTPCFEVGGVVPWGCLPGRGGGKVAGRSRLAPQQYRSTAGRRERPKARALAPRAKAAEHKL